MDILSAAEGHFEKTLKENAFYINTCIKDQTKDGALDKLINAIRQYDSAKSQLDIVKNLKAQLESINNEDQTNTNNN